MIQPDVVVLKARVFRVLAPSRPLPFDVERRATEAAHKAGIDRVRRVAVIQAKMLADSVSEYRCRVFYADVAEAVPA